MVLLLEASDPSVVPEEYHTLVKVFSMQRAPPTCFPVRCYFPVTYTTLPDLKRKP